MTSIKCSIGSATGLYVWYIYQWFHDIQCIAIHSGAYTIEQEVHNFRHRLGLLTSSHQTYSLLGLQRSCRLTCWVQL